MTVLHEQRWILHSCSWELSPWYNGQIMSRWASCLASAMHTSNCWIYMNLQSCAMRMPLALDSDQHAACGQASMQSCIKVHRSEGETSKSETELSALTPLSRLTQSSQTCMTIAVHRVQCGNQGEHLYCHLRMAWVLGIGSDWLP